MKKLYFALFLLGTAPAVLSVRAQPADTAYAQAVAQYVQAAESEAKVLRTDTEKYQREATPERKDAFKQVFASLDECDKLVAQLKTATPRTFDPLKSRYEQTRGEASKALEKARQG